MKMKTYGRMRRIWRIWAKSLGEKVGETDKQADTIAVIRSIWWLTHMLTCMAIILNAVANHGWGLLGISQSPLINLVSLLCKSKR